MHVHQTRAYRRVLDFDDNKCGVRSEVLVAMKTKTSSFWFVRCLSLQQSTNMQEESAGWILCDGDRNGRRWNVSTSLHGILLQIGLKDYFLWVERKEKPKSNLLVEGFRQIWNMLIKMWNNSNFLFWGFRFLEGMWTTKFIAITKLAENFTISLATVSFFRSLLLGIV